MTYPILQVRTADRAFTAGFEGCSLVAYRCPAGTLTIGEGHTEGVKDGDTLPDVAAADALLLQDLEKVAAVIGALIGTAPTSPNQAGAMLDFAFNLGNGAFASSSVLRKHRAGDYAGAAAAFLLWDHAVIDGVFQAVPGLTRRRSAEAAIYLAPGDHPMPASAPVVPGTMPQSVGAPAGMLAAGMCGEAVASLQTALAHAGFYAGKLDGDFGPGTRMAVAAFQRAHGLEVDGVAGPKTQAVLRNC